MRKYLFLVFFSFVSVSLSAQSKHELSVNLGGGLSGISAETTSLLDIKVKSKAGLNFGVGYAYNFSESFAFLTGLQADLNKTGFQLDQVSGEYVVMDREGHWFKFGYDGKNYQEDLKYSYLSVPLMVRYKHAVKDNLGIYAAIGPKVGVNLKSSYKSSLESVNTEGAYVLWGQGDDVPVIDDLEMEGFGSFSKTVSDGPVELKPMLTLAAELGLHFPLNENLGMYVGAYLDYALNGVEKSSIKHFVEYDHKSAFPVHLNSMSHSQYMKDDVNSMVAGMKPFKAGLKVSVSFGL